MASEFRADPNEAWDTDLSERHEELGDRLQQILTDFQAGESITPLAVVGPYGSGKTQFLYEVYRRSWKNGIPAVYTDLSSVLEGYDQASPDISPTDWVEQKIDTEVESFLQTGTAEWMPNFRTEAGREEFVENISEKKSIEKDKRVLLIDEVEQKYTELDEYFQTDDDNPLREVLDKLSDVFQVWSFGLVSAYEVLGEADLRRFQEARIPISDVVTVENHLQELGRPSELANGIWWLARGRFGWVSKCIDMYPRTAEIQDEEVTSWLDEVSDYSYYGADAINLVWTEVDGNDVISAKQTITFTEPAYDPWVVKGRNVIPTKTAHSKIMDGIQELADVEGDVYKIISTNLRDVLQGLSPASNRPSNEKAIVETYLPDSAFNRTEHMQGLIDLTTDFISSFEKRGDTRSDAVGTLNEININQLTDDWIRIREGIVELADKDPWTVDPTIVQEAFPPLALNPGILTDKKTSELRKNLDEPIRIRPEIDFPSGRIVVYLCPTEASYQQAQQNLSTLADITRANLLITPQAVKEWQTKDHTDRLKSLDLVHTVEGGSDRLWDFIVQLGEYMRSIDAYNGTISNELIENEVIPQEEQDQKRNTIKSLFEEIRRITKNESQRTRESYLSAYSLGSTQTLIWNDNSLAGETPFYAATGRGATWRVALAYGIVFSEKSIGDVDVSGLLKAAITAYDKEYIQQGQFGYKYLIERIFEVDTGDLAPHIIELRRKYGTDAGGLDDEMVRLQRALGYLSELNDETPADLYIRLRDSETKTSEVTVLGQSQFNNEQANALCWGLLLAWCIENNGNVHANALSETQEALSRLQGRTKDIKGDIEFINDRLTPPATVSLDNTVRVQTEQIENYQQNVSKVVVGYDELLDQLSRYPGLSLATLLIDDISGVYYELFGDTISILEDTLSKIDLTSTIKDLQTDYRDLQSWSEDSSVVQNVGEVDHKTLHTNINELGEFIFDYKQVVDSQEVPLNDIEVLLDLDEEIKSDQTRLGSIARRVESVESERENITNRSDSIQSELKLVGEQLQDTGNK